MIEVKEVKFTPFTNIQNIPNSTKDIGLIGDVPLNISVEFGNTYLSIEEVLKLKPGSVVNLNKEIGEPAKIYVNDKLVAYGEIVVIDDNFGVKITKLLNKNNS